MSLSSPSSTLLRSLFPLIPRKERRRFFLLQLLAVLMALSELMLTGLVALLAAVFGSPEAVLNNNPVSWLRENAGIDFGNDPRLLALTVLFAIFFAIAWKNILTVYQQWQIATFSESVGAAAKNHVFRFYQRMPFLEVSRSGVADLSFGLGAAMQLAATLNTALQISTSIFMLITLFIGLVSISPIPSLMFMGILGVGGTIIVKFLRRVLDRAAATVFMKDQSMNKITHLALHGLKEMRLYRRENFLFSAYQKQQWEIVEAKRRQLTLVRLPVCGLEILGFCTLLGVMLFLIFGQNAGMARISGIMGFMAATAWRGLPVANRLVDAISLLRSQLPYLQKVADIIKQELEMAAALLSLDDAAPSSLLPFDKKIVLDKVCFRYPGAGKQAVDTVSLTINAGTMVGLVGLSGAGKSTLVNLLTGLIPPDSGQLLVDGIPITRDTASAWLGKIGYVAQSPYIIDASLAENVALSRWGEEVDRKRVLECCRMASLDFLDELEKGIDTVLGDRGTRLSGGQAQRVAIARALYNEPELIIFDEATSALDMKNEKAIHETILSLRNSVTMVIIAHRLTTVEGCDTLVWLENGRIFRQGSPAEVLPEYEEALRQSPMRT